MHCAHTHIVHTYIVYTYIVHTYIVHTYIAHTCIVYTYIVHTYKTQQHGHAHNSVRRMHHTQSHTHTTLYAGCIKLRC